MIGSGCYKWYQSRSSTSMWGFVPFCLVIPWDKTRTLCLHVGWCLSHLTSDKGESSRYYKSMGSSQPRRHVLKPRGPLGVKVNNSYMVGSGRYKWYQSRSSAGFTDLATKQCEGIDISLQLVCMFFKNLLARSYCFLLLLFFSSFNMLVNIIFILQLSTPFFRCL